MAFLKNLFGSNGWSPTLFKTGEKSSTAHSSLDANTVNQANTLNQFESIRSAFSKALADNSPEEFYKAADLLKSVASQGDLRVGPLLETLMQSLGMGTRIVPREMFYDHKVVCQVVDIIVRKYDQYLQQTDHDQLTMKSR